MHKVRKFGVIALVLILLIYLLNSYVFINGTWRYKITVEVDTPEGVKTGFAVREVSAAKGLKLLPEMGTRVKFRGEAVVVDLGARGVLFALITGDYGASLPAEVFYPERAWRTAEGIEFMSALKKGASVELKEDRYPILARFENIQDPKTIQHVVTSELRIDEIHKFDPRRPVLTFEQAFGMGVKLRSVNIQPVDEDITWGGVDGYLPWLQRIGLLNLAGERGSGQDWYQNLDAWQFKKEK